MIKCGEGLNARIDTGFSCIYDLYRYTKEILNARESVSFNARDPNALTLIGAFR